MRTQQEIVGGRAYRAFVVGQGFRLISIESGWVSLEALDALITGRDEVNGSVTGPFSADYLLLDADDRLVKVVELKTKATGNSSVAFSERQVRTARHLGPYYRLVMMLCDRARPTMATVDDPVHLFDSAIVYGPDDPTARRGVAAESKWHVMPENILASSEVQQIDDPGPEPDPIWRIRIKERECQLALMSPEERAKAEEEAFQKSFGRRKGRSSPTVPDPPTEPKTPQN